MYDLNICRILCYYIAISRLKISILVREFYMNVKEIVIIYLRTALYIILSWSPFMLISRPQQEIRYLREIQLRATIIVATGCF
jgi:hypothetical protein